MHHKERLNLFASLDANTLDRLSKYFKEHAAEATARAATLKMRDRSRREIERKLDIKPRLTKAERKAVDRRFRNKEIMRLVARGWSDQKIGEKVGLHKNSISRIVRREIELDERGWHGRNPR